MSFRLILDSGAYSAWTSKSKISLNDYTQFCLANQSQFDYIVNLDVIPAEFGQVGIPEKERERSAKEGWINFLKMIDAGIPQNKIIPVFHQEENFRWLKKMMLKSKYIGISPANDRNTPQKIEWLDECMKYVCNEYGMPIVKFHGFGITSVKILRRYPFYSADSSTWVKFSRYGTILIPKTNKNQWRYDKNPIPIQVTKRASSRKEDNWKHFDSIPKEAQDVVVKYVTEKGFEMGESKFDDKKEIAIRSGVRNSHRIRDLINLQFFIDLEKNLPKWPSRYEGGGGF
uniref:Putative queuosine tRNA-ribosyltransferase n=1 Tax=viral metagenome TaxID=1070528 RepID=A0A6M3KMF8_9ZZZZ